MIVLHDTDGSAAPLDDPAALYARILKADPADWQGDAGELGLEAVGANGSAWLYLSLVAPGRYLLSAETRDGDYVEGFEPGGDPAVIHTLVQSGRSMELADSELVPPEQANEAAGYFVSQSGFLSPLIYWRKNGEPYWPAFE